MLIEVTIIILIIMYFYSVNHYDYVVYKSILCLTSSTHINISKSIFKSPHPKCKCYHARGLYL